MREGGGLPLFSWEEERRFTDIRGRQNYKTIMFMVLSHPVCGNYSRPRRLRHPISLIILSADTNVNNI